MIGAAGILALAQGIGISFIPQSPRFLVLRAARSGALLARSGALLPGGEIMDEARASLQFFRLTPDVDTELDTMRHEITKSVGTEAAKWTDAFGHPRQLLIGCGLVFLQQVSGQPSVLYFATNIFKSAGFGTSAALSSVGVGLVKLLATLFTVWRVDRC